MEYVIDLLRSPSDTALAQLIISAFWLVVAVISILLVRGLDLKVKTPVPIASGFAVAHLIIAAGIWFSSL